MVIAYLRVSSEKQHLENQQLKISKFAEQRGLQISKWVAEVVSGKENQNDRRLGLFIKKLKKGDILIAPEKTTDGFEVNYIKA